MTRLILASASKARAALLKGAGIDVEIYPADVDEAAIKRDLKSKDTASAQIASSLAHAKARNVSDQQEDAMVVGADQVLIHEGVLFDKPRSMDEAKQHLQILRSKTHRLISAVSVAQNGVELWSQSTHADLTMRDFSDKFLSSYLECFGEQAMTSVGAYHLEGLGSQLFSRVEGDYFTILGLPLLELLEFLRCREILKS